MDAKPREDPPHGMEPYDLGDSGDLGALSPEQQTKLNNFKVLVKQLPSKPAIFTNEHAVYRFYM